MLDSSRHPHRPPLTHLLLSFCGALPEGYINTFQLPLHPQVLAQHPERPPDLRNLHLEPHQPDGLTANQLDILGRMWWRCMASQRWVVFGFQMPWSEAHCHVVLRVSAHSCVAPGHL